MQQSQDEAWEMHLALFFLLSLSGENPEEFVRLLLMLFLPHKMERDQRNTETKYFGRTRVKTAKSHP